MERIDVKGLSCPQPAFDTKKMLDKLGKGELEVLTDSGTARDNIVRLAKKNGWEAEIAEENGDILIKLKK
ncbi:MAG: sulfurtransferase TusA family protein [Candidatus Cloacimonas sp.]|jgi:TusA-related sulfurtransferase|nr:sulfurtransferase TusA family protein [Candidatus Cloacimonadota bacterium]